MELNALTRWESIGKKLHELGLQKGIAVEQQLDALKKQMKQRGKGKVPLPMVNSIGIPLYDVAQLASDGQLHTPVSGPREEHIEADDDDRDTQDVRNVGVPRKHARAVNLVYRGIRRFGKGFLFGYLGKLAFTLIPILIRLRFNPIRSFPHIMKAIYSSDVLGYGTFLGGFLCLFESMMRAFRTTISQSYRPLVAGLVAGVALVLLPADSRVGLSMFFLVRALEIAAKAGAERGLLPRVPQADVLVMGLASSQVIWCWLNKRDALDPSYARFLDVHGGKTRLVQDAFAACSGSNQQNGFPHPDVFAPLNARVTVSPRHPLLTVDDHGVFCHILHPEHQSCSIHFLYFLKDAFWRSLPVYLPVYVLPLVLFKHKALMRMPVRLLSHTLLNTLRSSFFLAMYCSMCWFTSCTLRNAGSYNTKNAMLAGFIGGSMVAIEAPGRRIELALYVLSHAIQSFYRCWRSWGVLPYIPHFEVLVFSASMSVVLTAYVDAPHLLRASYFSLLKWFFGSGGKAAGFSPAEHLSVIDDKIASLSIEVTPSPATATAVPATHPPTPSPLANTPFQHQLELLNQLQQQQQQKQPSIHTLLAKEAQEKLPQLKTATPSPTTSPAPTPAPMTAPSVQATPLSPLKASLPPASASASASAPAPAPAPASVAVQATTPTAGDARAASTATAQTKATEGQSNKEQTVPFSSSSSSSSSSPSIVAPSPRAAVSPLVPVSVNSSAEAGGSVTSAPSISPPESPMPELIDAPSVAATSTSTSAPLGQTTATVAELIPSPSPSPSPSQSLAVTTLDQFLDRPSPTTPSSTGSTPAVTSKPFSFPKTSTSTAKATILETSETSHTDANGNGNVNGTGNGNVNEDNGDRDRQQPQQRRASTASTDSSNGTTSQHFKGSKAKKKNKKRK